MVSPRCRPGLCMRAVNLGSMYAAARRAAGLRRGVEVVSPRCRPGLCRWRRTTSAPCTTRAKAYRRTMSERICGSIWLPRRDYQRCSFDRDKVALLMTPAQIAEAQKLAREWNSRSPQQFSSLRDRASELLSAAEAGLNVSLKKVGGTFVVPVRDKRRDHARLYSRQWRC